MDKERGTKQIRKQTIRKTLKLLQAVNLVKKLDEEQYEAHYNLNVNKMFILPIQAMTLETSLQRKNVMFRGNTLGGYSTSVRSLGEATYLSSSPSKIDSIRMSTSSNDDSNDMEVGVEWINDYTWKQNLDGWLDLSHCDEDAKGFYNKLGDEGWTKKFDYGNDDAWESDFEKLAVGGSDSYVVDNVDFAYFAGHGDKEFLLFSTDVDGDGSHTKRVHYSEVKWGDGDLEWITLASCETLHPEYKDEWISHACEGKHLHAICGFKGSPPDDETLGKTFAKKLTNGKGSKDAWKTATKEVCGSDVEAAIIYAKVYYNIYLVHNYAQETLPNEGDYIGTDPSYYAGMAGYSVDYYYESWGC